MFNLTKFNGSSVVKHIAIGAGDLGFDSPVGRIGQLATTTTFLRRCVANALSRVDGPGTYCTLRPNTTGIMKIAIFFQQWVCQFSCQGSPTNHFAKAKF